MTTPDTAIINWFPLGSDLGMHQDKSEDPKVITGGSPIVTLSLGATATFRLGTPWSKNKVADIQLQTGDLLVMAGQNRLAYHGIINIHPGTTPPLFEMKESGRISITIRQSHLSEAKPSR